MNTKSRNDLKDAVQLYLQVKELIMLAEELDPEYRSNLLPIREMRDALDHIMRVHAEDLSDEKRTNGEKYIQMQIDKAVGHFCRAGYDSADGIIVGYKLRFVKALSGISSDAMTAVYPDYYEDYEKFDILIFQSVENRKKKDIGSSDIIKNLRDYMVVAVKTARHCKRGMAKVPALKDFERRAWRKLLFEQFVLAAFVSIIAGVTIAGILRGFGWGTPSPQPASSSQPAHKESVTTNKP
jgi:hypothetical protein